MDFSKISAVILVKNAQATLQECLRSIQCFDEIILLDNQSNDDTLKLLSLSKNLFPIFTFTQVNLSALGR